MPPRVVLDTNVVVSALVFSAGRLAWLWPDWMAGRIRPLVSQPAARELIRVLEYPKLQLGPRERETLLGDYLPACEVVTVPRRISVPECRDPADRMFLELALAGKADLLVTGDADLLSLADVFAVPIVNAERLRSTLRSSANEAAAQAYAPTPRKRAGRARTRAAA